MKNIYVDSCECLILEEDFKKDIVSLEELLNKYEDMHYELDILQERVEELKNALNEVRPNYNYDI